MNLVLSGKTISERDPHDFYPTPAAFVIAALNHLPPESPECISILDPGAGDGVWGLHARKKFPNSIIDGVEKHPVMNHPAYTNWWETDYLEPGRFFLPTYSLIIGNPPYKYAEAFIRKSLLLLNSEGWLVQLVRTGFLHGQARGKGLWVEFPPVKVGLCSRRPSFTGNGKTDASEYCIVYWKKGFKGTAELFWMNDI